MKIYTGIGSRRTPPDILAKMEWIASVLSKSEWTLRSGGADGADSAFEKGCGLGKKEIYLPWKKFNQNQSPLYDVPEEAISLASTIHPAWHACSHGAKLLHGRNTMQVLGKDLKTKSDLVICWTDTGGLSGGTATAMKLAMDNGIPVVNMFNENWEKELHKVLMAFDGAYLMAVPYCCPTCIEGQHAVSFSKSSAITSQVNKECICGCHR